VRTHYRGEQLAVDHIFSGVLDLPGD